MSVGHIIVYVIAVVLVVVALVRRSYSVKARSIKGNVVQMRDNAATINQTYTEAGGAKEAGPDRIAWAIGIVGVLVALAQLAHDIFWAK
jgi:hypothetical protein